MNLTDTLDNAHADRVALIEHLTDEKIRLALAYIAEHAPDVFDAATTGRDQRQHERIPAAGNRFRCALGSPGRLCAVYARVTITDVLGDTARGCVRHAIDALDHIPGSRVDWADTKGLNEYELMALRITDDRASLRPGGNR